MPQQKAIERTPRNFGIYAGMSQLAFVFFFRIRILAAVQAPGVRLRNVVRRTAKVVPSKPIFIRPIDAVTAASITFFKTRIQTASVACVAISNDGLKIVAVWRRESFEEALLEQVEAGLRVAVGQLEPFQIFVG